MSDPRLFNVYWERFPKDTFVRLHPIQVELPGTELKLGLSAGEADLLSSELQRVKEDYEKYKSNRERLLAIKNSAWSIHDGIQDYLKGTMSLDDLHAEIGPELEDIKKFFDALEVL